MQYVAFVLHAFVASLLVMPAAEIPDDDAIHDRFWPAGLSALYAAIPEQAGIPVAAIGRVVDLQPQGSQVRVAIEAFDGQAHLLPVPAAVQDIDDGWDPDDPWTYFEEGAPVGGYLLAIGGLSLDGQRFTPALVRRWMPGNLLGRAGRCGFLGLPDEATARDIAEAFAWIGPVDAERVDRARAALLAGLPRPWWQAAIEADIVLYHGALLPDEAERFPELFLHVAGRKLPALLLQAWCVRAGALLGGTGDAEARLILATTALGLYQDPAIAPLVRQEALRCLLAGSAGVRADPALQQAVQTALRGDYLPGRWEREQELVATWQGEAVALLRQALLERLGG